MAQKRDRNAKEKKVKIPPHKVDKFIENEINDSDITNILNSLNGYERHPKNIIKDILKFKPKVKFKNKKQKDFHTLLMDKDAILCQGAAGTGKAQPLYSKIYTPDGYKLMGDIKVGDEICSTDGGTTNVIGVYPQGEKDVYRITFDDETHVDCCGEHLWEVTTYRERDRAYKGRRVPKKEVLKTIDMLDNIKTKNNKSNYKIDVIKPLLFKEQEIIIDPYLIGCLIGDGGMTNGNTTITTIDGDIINEITKIIKPLNLKLKKGKNNNGKENISYRIINEHKKNSNILKDVTTELGIRCKTENKFIPRKYLYNTIENRIKLLQGLMDTDGTVDKRNGTISFSTSSPQLKDDYCELIQSLGGIAKVYTKKTRKLDNYIIHINLPNTQVFRLDRKLKYVRNRVKYHPCRFIKKIEKIGKVKQQCIMVDHENHLYVTDNCTITHNTYIAVYTAIKLLMEDNDIYRIVLTKPSQQLRDENLGYLKGGIDEKIMPIMESYDAIFEEMIGRMAFSQLVEEGIIIHKPLSFLRGQTLKNSVILFDEVQMSTLHVCRTLMQRFGESSKMYLLGDEAQVERYNRKNNPLTLLLNKVENNDLYDCFGTFRFGIEDIVRHPLISTFEKIFDEIEIENNIKE